MIQKIFGNWRLMWPLQALMMILIALCATLLPLLFPAAHMPLRLFFLWLLPCTVGAWSSFRLTRCGLTCYAAWLLPPVMHTAVPWLVLGFPPTPISMALCALVSLVGAAAGDVLNKQEHS